MNRIFCFPLLCVLILPAFAQEEPSGIEQALPRDPALLSRMREQFSIELQHVQQMLSFVSDAQTRDALTAQQTELTKQLLDITRQMQAISQPPSVPGTGGDVLPPMGREEVLPRTPSFPIGRGTTLPARSVDLPPGLEALPPELRGSGIPSNVPPVLSPVRPDHTMSLLPPSYPVGMPSAGMPMGWGEQERSWEAAHWGPRLPRELTEVKQSVESLEKEISTLKETIRALEV